MKFKLQYDLGSLDESEPIGRKVGLREKIDFLRDWTLPFVIQASAGRNVEIEFVYHYDASQEVHQALDELQKEFGLSLVAISPFEQMTVLDEDAVRIELSPSLLVLPGVFECLEHWEVGSFGGLPYRFCRYVSATVINNALRGAQLVSAVTPALLPAIRRNSLAYADTDLSVDRFVIDRSTLAVIEVRNSPFVGQQKPSVPAENVNTLSPGAFQRVLPAALRGKVFEPQQRTIELHAADPYDGPVVIDVDLHGPFVLTLSGEIAGGVFPKHSLICFEFERDGRKVERDVDIPGVAYSPNPSIGYFFYFLNAQPGPFTFEYSIPLPDDVKCSKIQVMKWDSNRRAMKCHAIEVAEI